MPPLLRVAALVLLAGLASGQGAAPGSDPSPAAKRAYELRQRIRHELVERPHARLMRELRLLPSEGDRVRDILELHALDVFRRFHEAGRKLPSRAGTATGRGGPPVEQERRGAPQDDFRFLTPEVLSRVLDALEPRHAPRFMALVGEAKCTELRALARRRAKMMKKVAVAPAAGRMGKGGRGKGRGGGKMFKGQDKGKGGAPPKGFIDFGGGDERKGRGGRRGGRGGGRRSGGNPFGF